MYTYHILNFPSIVLQKMKRGIFHILTNISCPSIALIFSIWRMIGIFYGSHLNQQHAEKKTHGMGKNSIFISTMNLSNVTSEPNNHQYKKFNFKESQFKFFSFSNSRCFLIADAYCTLGSNHPCNIYTGTACKVGHVTQNCIAINTKEAFRLPKTKFYKTFIHSKIEYLLLIDVPVRIYYLIHYTAANNIDL